MSEIRLTETQQGIAECQDILATPRILTYRRDQPSFSTWWGGYVQGTPAIATAIPELRRRIGGLKGRKKEEVKFEVKSAKELMIKFRAAIDEMGLLSWITEMPSAKSLDVQKGTGADVHAVVRIGCPDGSYIDLHGYGQGADSQDKAGGKAVTYAWKAALIYGLCLPDKEMVDTDDDDAPGGRDDQGRATPLARGKNVRAPSEALEDEKNLLILITSASTVEAVEAIKAQVIAARTAGDIGPDNVKRLAAALGARKQELALINDGV